MERNSRLDTTGGKLIWYIRKGKIEDAMECIRLGVNINHQNKSGFTPLMKAVYFNHQSLVKELLLRGSYLNLRNNKGYTCMDIAFIMNRADILEELHKKLVVQQLKKLVNIIMIALFWFWFLYISPWVGIHSTG